MPRTPLFPRLFGAGLLLLAAVPPLPAGPISWSYSATVGNPDGPPSAYGQSYAEFVGGGSNEAGQLVAFHTTNLSPTPALLQGPANIPVGTISVQNFAWDFRSGGSGYAYSLALTDRASGQTGSVGVSGTLQASFTAQWVGQSQGGFVQVPGGGKLTNTFTSPTAQSVVLGGNRYDVTFSFVPGPYVQGSYQGGEVHADVQVSGAPEPGTLGLAAVGLIGTGLAAWRRRRSV
jgi:hypothetical protein